MRIDLSGRTALVTGAGRNIGRAIALRLAGAGAEVACCWRQDAAAAEAVAAQIRAAGGRADSVPLDLADVDSIRRAADTVLARAGRLDILVNNAAVRPRRKVGDVTVHEWDLVHRVNLRGPFFLDQAVIPAMREHGFGRIIHVGGLDAYWGKAQRPHVVASKLGLVGLSRALANETARWGITVNTLVPGTIDTDRPRPDWYPDMAEYYRQRRDRIPVGELGTPDDLSACCVFLASPHARYVTGQELLVTGGAYPLVHQPSDDY